MKKIRLLFQGDSITDAGRDKRNFHDVGKGYAKYAAEQMVKDHPDVEFDFINLGISGNRTDQLFDRLYADAIALQPDIISILIGVNDVGHRHAGVKIATTDAQIELNYRTILTELKNKTNAKIMILSPFVLDAPDRDGIREDLKTVIPIIRGLADEFADAFVPLNELFDEAMKVQPEPLYYSNDGVHPNENGRKFIGEIYAREMKALIDKFKN